MQIQLLLNYGKSILFNRNSYKYPFGNSLRKKKYFLSSNKSEESNLKPDEIFSLQSKHLNLKLTNESVHLPTQVFLITKNESSALTNQARRANSKYGYVGCHFISAFGTRWIRANVKSTHTD